jgi:hypothetical protein
VAHACASSEANRREICCGKDELRRQVNEQQKKLEAPRSFRLLSFFLKEPAGWLAEEEEEEEEEKHKKKIDEERVGGEGSPERQGDEGKEEKTRDAGMRDPDREAKLGTVIAECMQACSRGTDPRTTAGHGAQIRPWKPSINRHQHSVHAECHGRQPALRAWASALGHPHSGAGELRSGHQCARAAAPGAIRVQRQHTP